MEFSTLALPVLFITFLFLKDISVCNGTYLACFMILVFYFAELCIPFHRLIVLSYSANDPWRFYRVYGVEH